MAATADGLIEPPAPTAADRWPYDPLAAELAREPFTIVARELGENRIIELMSNESEYGDEDMARLRLMEARIEPRPPPPGPREPVRVAAAAAAVAASRLKWKSVLASELAAPAAAAAAACKSASWARDPR